jgi:hypothetical protein
MTDTMSNTYVSDPSGNPPVASTAPGALGPLGQISMTQAVLIPLGTAAVGLGALYWLFRKGGVKLPPLRIDAANVLNVYFSWLILDVPITMLAYKYHGHKVSQAFLLVK